MKTSCVTLVTSPAPSRYAIRHAASLIRFFGQPQQRRRLPLQATIRTMITPVHQLIYVSAAKVSFSDADLASLLLKARENNRRLGVSGLLIHRSGSFFQVLEGGEDVVENLFRRIERDRRHERVVVLHRASQSAPTFGQWSIGFVAGERAEVERIPGFNDFFHSGFTKSSLKDAASQAAALAKAFRDGRFHQFVEGR